MRVKVGYPDEWRTYEGVTIEESLETLPARTWPRRSGSLTASTNRSTARSGTCCRRGQRLLQSDQQRDRLSRRDLAITLLRLRGGPGVQLRWHRRHHRPRDRMDSTRVAPSSTPRATSSIGGARKTWPSSRRWQRRSPRSMTRSRRCRAERRWRPDDRREHRRHGRSADRLRRAASHARRRGRPRLDRGAHPGGALLHRLRLQLGEKAREQAIRTQVLTDEHAPAAVRAVQPARNMDSFFETFGIEPADPMYLPPEERHHLVTHQAAPCFEMSTSTQRRCHSEELQVARGISSLCASWRGCRDAARERNGTFSPCRSNERARVGPS